jgi:Vitamin K-dependent gamma-carboxylase
MKRLSAWRERLIGFCFPTDSDTWLAVLRIGLGLQVVLYALSLRDDWSYLLAGTGHGLISRNLGEAILSLESQLVPRLGWLVTLGTHAGLHEETVLSVAWICLIASGCSLLIGLASRFSAILAWFLHLCAAKSGGFISYGVDNFMTIGLFYLMLSPLPDQYSLDWWLRKSRSRDPQHLGFWRRVLQLHLCLIYFFSGLTKCLGSGWWDGTNIWRALIRPPFNVIDPEILVRWRHLFPVAGIFICLLEIGYPFLIWNRKTRKIWLIGICVMHAGIGLAMGMYLFAFTMIILNLAAFGPGLIRANLPTYRLGTVGRGSSISGKRAFIRVRVLVWAIAHLLSTTATTAVRIRSTKG